MEIKLADLGMGFCEVWSIACHEDELLSNQTIKLYTPGAETRFQIRLDAIVEQYDSKVAITYRLGKREKS
jgi:hypothetical protein